MEQRLIDANAMQEKAFLMNFHGRINERELFLFNRALSEMPTIDAVQVVHGEWNEHVFDCSNHSVNYCTVCGLSLPYNVPKWKPNYCPNCGADMRKGETDDNA